MGQSLKNQVMKSISLWHGHEKQKMIHAGQGISLTDFIRKNTEEIVSEWETFARTLKPASNDMTPLALRNHIHQILDFIISDIESYQTNSEQIQKSHGEKEKSDKPTAAETHAALRLAGGFDIEQMISEYRALRASVIKLWGLANTQMNNLDFIDLTRFNESIDQELAESVSHYTDKISYSKDLFIGVLSHELRNPLNVISMSVQLMLNMGLPAQTKPLDERQTMLASQIFESTSRAAKIVSDLLDVTRARFGYGFSVSTAPMDMGFVSKQLVDEMRVAYPARAINLDVSGDLKGKWDKARIGQVFSNLISNAIQYSIKDSAIDVAVKGAPNEVMLSVHNEGIPIPSEKFLTLFDPLTRAVTHEGEHPVGVNLGLGLFITDEIVASHGGSLDVTSSEEGGTTFTARFPRSV